MISARASLFVRLFRSRGGLLLALALAGLLLAVPQQSSAQEAAAPPQEPASGPTGVWLMTAYPQFSAPAGERIEIALEFTNKGLPPQRAALAVQGLPEGWQWEILGGGKPVASAIAATGQAVELELALTPPEDAAMQAYPLTVVAETGDDTLELPLTVTLVESEPASLTLEPELPALRGTVRSTFDFQVIATNEGQEDTVVNLLSEAPAGFQVTFKERYGSQELTSVPIDAGQSKDLKVSVEPPENIAAGQYPVIVAVSGGEASARQELVLDITGQPELALSGPGGRVSGEATAGEARSFTFTLENSGTAAARQVAFSASPPQGWDVTFEPEEVAEVAPGQTAEVAVSITPSANAIAGDYVVPVRANAEGANDSANFRVTVETSTLWGVAGLGVIAAAVVVLGFSVSRYGRR